MEQSQAWPVSEGNAGDEEVGMSINTQNTQSNKYPHRTLLDQTIEKPSLEETWWAGIEEC